MVHTNPEFENFEFDSRLEFHQHLGSLKHVINIIMGFRDMGCYTRLPAEVGFGAAMCSMAPDLAF
jgi:hypothetical protein